MIDDIIDRIIEAEGGYVDHPDDRGGPTMYGITLATARQYGYSGNMEDLHRETAVAIYKTRYYLDPNFDLIEPISPAIAEEITDTGVNMGPNVASLFLQRSLNALNRAGRDYPDLKTDGVVGHKTAEALADFLRFRTTSGEHVLLKALNCLQGARYITLAESREKDESFVYGWLRERVSL